MQIKLTKNINIEQENLEIGSQYEAVLISPRSTTVEFVTESGNTVRLFHYEYETVNAAE